MTPPSAPLTEAVCRRHVHDVVFGGALDRTDPGRRLLGVELEWLTARSRDLARLDLPTAVAARDATAPLPSGATLTLEPGGQLELSSAPSHSVDALCHTTMTEVFHLDRGCEGHGVELVALGTDPARRPERVLRQARYAAMERYFDTMGPAGRTMMHNTASIQVNVGLGHGADTAARWQAAHRIGPAMVAAFANSGIAHRAPTGWRSTRLQTWRAIDPTRTAAALDPAAPPAEAWLRYALAARVAFVASADGGFEPVLGPPLPFGAWVGGAGPADLRPPTLDDFVYHLTTLFPPVRPRGWFEVRYLDALPTPFWTVATAVTIALVTHPEARERAGRVLDRTGADHRWEDAARIGLDHPAVAAAATELLSIARTALPDLGAGDALAELVDSYVDRWTARGRCPADDRLDAWRATGELFPPRASPVPYGLDQWAPHR